MEQQLQKSTTIEAKKEGPVHEYDLVGSFSSSSSSSVSGNSSGSSTLESDSFEEVTSAPSSSSPSSSSSVDRHAPDPLSDMSSLFQQLPIKRGLSKFYEGKSQSFTSLASVRSLEDLAKPENPYNKKLKSCRSYEGGLSKFTPSGMSRHVSKRGLHSSSSRGSCSSSSAKKGSVNFIGSRPPIPPHRSTSTSTIPNQTALFA